MCNICKSTVSKKSLKIKSVSDIIFKFSLTLWDITSIISLKTISLIHLLLAVRLQQDNCSSGVFIRYLNEFSFALPVCVDPFQYPVPILDTTIPLQNIFIWCNFPCSLTYFPVQMWKYVYLFMPRIKCGCDLNCWYLKVSSVSKFFCKAAWTLSWNILSVSWTVASHNVENLKGTETSKAHRTPKLHLLERTNHKGLASTLWHSLHQKITNKICFLENIREMDIQVHL